MADATESNNERREDKNIFLVSDFFRKIILKLVFK